MSSTTIADESDSSPPIYQFSFQQMLADLREHRDDGAEELFSRYEPYIRQLAEQYLDSDIRPKVSGSDIVQTSVMEACHGLTKFRGGTENEFRYWLRRIVVNNVLNEYRFWSAERRSAERRSRALDAKLADELAANEASPPTKASRSEMQAMLLDRLSDLSDEHRRVIELRNRDGLSFRQIAGCMERSEDAVRMLWARAMRALVRKFQSDD